MFDNERPPSHGGDLISASLQYAIAIDDWLDLSTGLNPDGYPIPDVPAKIFRRLPFPGELELVAAAKNYYACKHLLAAAGSQRIIQLLPALRKKSRVAIADVGYQEHHYHWSRHGHTVVFYCSRQPALLTQKIEANEVDCVVLINPSNPTTTAVDVDLLLHWQKHLAKKGGWLIIDEAFIDASPSKSFASYSDLPGVIVLRSLGKFFGLAGIRVGFALAQQSLISQLTRELGPWSVAGPAQFIATRALQDVQWHKHTQALLIENSLWMQNLFLQAFDNITKKIVATSLFVSVTMDVLHAQLVREALAKRGILVRYWSLPEQDEALLRFGLISVNDKKSRLRFQSSLSEVLTSLQLFSIM